jgi:hypothetical protein
MRAPLVIAVAVLTLVAPGLMGKPSLTAQAPPPGPVVNVSSESQLQVALQSLVSNSTIVIAPGTYELTGTLSVGDVSDVTIRGATNNADDVVLVGRGMSNQGHGPVQDGIWVSGTRVTIANLTVRDVYRYAIVFAAGTAPRLSNVHLLEAGEQFVRSNPVGAGGVDFGLVENSVFEYLTTAREPGTSAIDVRAATGWIIRNNLFRNLQAPAGQRTGPAVLVWNASSAALVEGNTFVNCQREIALGFVDRTPDDNTGGIVRNNFIYRAPAIVADVGIYVGDSPGTAVLHNTILANGTYATPIEYQFANTTGVDIRNNLLDGLVLARDGANGTQANNYEAATPSLFVNPAAGDLHLLASATAVIDRIDVVAGASIDRDGDTRPQGAAPTAAERAANSHVDRAGGQCPLHGARERRVQCVGG